MGACGGADPAGVTIRLAVNFGRLSFPCSYNVHRNSGIALVSIFEIVLKYKAVAASSGVAEYGSSISRGRGFAGGGAFAGGDGAFAFAAGAGAGMTAGGAALAIGAATMIVPVAGRGTSASYEGGASDTSSSATSWVRADAAGGGGVVIGKTVASGGVGAGPADDDAFDVAAGHS